MANWLDATEPLDDDPCAVVEALVRAAGAYVHATDDLRPRVLEAARLQCGERSARRRIRHLATTLLLLAMLTLADQSNRDVRYSARPTVLAAASFDDLFAPPMAAVPRSGDGDWRMIDAFTELRRQQAEALRFAL